MATTNPDDYLTAVEFKSRANITVADFDDRIADAILGAVRLIEARCARRFWADADVVQRLYWPRDPDVAVVHDISTTTGLVIEQDTTGDGTFDETWSADDYDLGPVNADAYDAADTFAPAHAWWEIHAVDDKSFRVGSRRPSLRVTARFGWSAVPDDITDATFLLANRLFRRHEVPNTGLDAALLPGGFAGIPFDIEARTGIDGFARLQLPQDARAVA